MGNDTILVNTTTWDTTSTTTSTGKTNSDDLVSDLFKTLNDLMTEMAPIFFVGSMQNLITALEDFGHGMTGALACVSTDLQVVSSGLSSAAVAFAATDKDLANTMAQLNTQLGYYTNTVTSTSLQAPSQADESALYTAYLQKYQSDPNGSNGWSLSQQQIQQLQKNSANAAAAGGIGIVGILIIIGICLI